LFKTELLE
jgi:hypothetical protein